MKIIFNKLQTSKETIQVSLDGGSTYTPYVVSEIIETGIPLDENQDFEKIRIKGPANVLKNLDVISSINTLYESNLLPEDITGLVLKDFNGKFDKSLLQKYPNLANVTIPNGVTTIGNSAFNGCSSLISVTIPDSVTSIGEEAFYDCRSLKNINIPDNIITINNRVFQHCMSLTSINIPSSVTSIGLAAFYNCSSLISVVIPEGITCISYNTFSYCGSLTSVTIPSSVISFGYDAFGQCSNLKTINYTGTEEQWDKIIKDEYWGGGQATINYNYQG